MAQARPLAVTIVAWYAAASGAILAVFASFFATSWAALVRDPAGLAVAIPGIVAGALAVAGGHASLEGRPWARPVLLAGLVCGVIVSGMLFFLAPVLVLAALNIVAIFATSQPDAKGWFAASARQGST